MVLWGLPKNVKNWLPANSMLSSGKCTHESQEYQKYHNCHLKLIDNAKIILTKTAIVTKVCALRWRLLSATTHYELVSLPVCVLAWERWGILMHSFSGKINFLCNPISVISQHIYLLSQQLKDCICQKYWWNHCSVQEMKKKIANRKFLCTRGGYGLWCLVCCCCVIVLHVHVQLRACMWGMCMSVPHTPNLGK